MTKYKIGQKVLIAGYTGFCTDHEDVIVDIQTRYDELTGEPYEIVICKNGTYKAESGGCIEGAQMYYLDGVKSQQEPVPFPKPVSKVFFMDTIFKRKKS